MFVRVEKDFFVNLNQVSSYLLKEEEDAIRLIIYINGKAAHNIVYLKCDSEELGILTDFVNAVRDITVNPEYSLTQLIKIQESKKVEENVNNKQDESK